MSEPGGVNHGIVIGGNANVSGSALAAGAGARAVHEGRTAQDAHALAARLRTLLAEAGTDDVVTADRRRTAEEALTAIEGELAAGLPAAGRPALIDRMRELALCLAGTGALAQAADQLVTAVRALLG
ncbi:hypothetical protein SUDANB58_03625 [Streptomyces sp. enrichment culture]|uniref:hypothetical protein n=1 Tax=Streptomyces sp. enrichment culture TaxID=1795815 RepID=UPI003F55A80A